MNFLFSGQNNEKKPSKDFSVQLSPKRSSLTVFKDELFGKRNNKESSRQYSNDIYEQNAMLIGSNLPVKLFS